MLPVVSITDVLRTICCHVHAMLHSPHVAASAPAAADACRYGDIAPHTTAQRVFVTCMMLSGASLYGYIIGAVSALLSSAGERRHMFIATMNKLNHFMESRMLPGPLRVRLRAYFR